jgi:hypothetical protein
MVLTRQYQLHGCQQIKLHRLQCRPAIASASVTSPCLIRRDKIVTMGTVLPLPVPTYANEADRPRLLKFDVCLRDPDYQIPRKDCNKPHLLACLEQTGCGSLGSGQTPGRSTAIRSFEGHLYLALRHVVNEWQRAKVQCGSFEINERF